MKKLLTITAIMFAAIGLLFSTVSIAMEEGKDMEQSSDSAISILEYSLKPVGYVQGDKFVESKLDMELKNNEETDQSFNVKIKFYDKDNNVLTSIKKKIDMDGGETKEYSDTVLLAPDTAEKMTNSKAFIEDIDSAGP